MTIMKIDIATGLLDSGEQQSTPNYDQRPAGVEPELLVIHSISLPPGEFGGPWITAFFANSLDVSAHPYFAEISQLKVSAHALIRRDGHIVQYVPFHERAWHAGQSSFQGRTHCNDFSIGIELEGSDDIPYTTEQYQQLVALIKVLFKAYPTLRRDGIVGHSDIAPGRKTDPGPSFDWAAFDVLLDQ